MHKHRCTNAALADADAEIDRRLVISTTAEYVESLNKQHTNKYMVRPDGTIEFYKDH